MDKSEVYHSPTHIRQSQPPCLKWILSLAKQVNKDKLLLFFRHQEYIVTIKIDPKNLLANKEKIYAEVYIHERKGTNHIMGDLLYH